MKKFLSTIAAVSLLMALFSSCEKDDNDESAASLPVVTTSEITNVKYSSAICGGNVTDDGGADIIERGICYSTKPNPTLSDKYVADVSKESGSFIMDVTDLAVNTQYYVRAYATNAAGTGLGEVKSFCTIVSDNIADNGGYDTHERVKLGLSVDWATCNVGAQGPEEAGYYVAWGETEPKSYYDWGTYHFCECENPQMPNTPTVFYKYNTNPQYGTVDNKTYLSPEDDIARIKWGGNWRMPNEKEWKELVDKCKWEPTFYRGCYGFRVIAKNDNSIFLPVWGYYMGDRNLHRDLCGYYWSGSLYSDPTKAVHLDMLYHLKTETYQVTMGISYRYCGLLVRAVHAPVIY